MSKLENERVSTSGRDRQARRLGKRRELSKSHARQMVAIREMKRAAIKSGKPWPLRNRKLLKLSKCRFRFIHRKPLTIDQGRTFWFECLPRASALARVRRPSLLIGLSAGRGRN
jgi:hypothetical protein